MDAGWWPVRYRWSTRKPIETCSSFRGTSWRWIWGGLVSGTTGGERGELSHQRREFAVDRNQAERRRAAREVPPDGRRREVGVVWDRLEGRRRRLADVDGGPGARAPRERVAGGGRCVGAVAGVGEFGASAVVGAEGRRRRRGGGLERGRHLAGGARRTAGDFLFYIIICGFWGIRMGGGSVWGGI